MTYNQIFNNGSTTCATCEAVNAYSYGVPEFVAFNCVL